VKVRDSVGLALVNLRKRRLRTVLTAMGVTVGIGALVAMISFGQGMEKNVTASFSALELFNVLTVFPSGASAFGRDPDEPGPRPEATAGPAKVLDDEAVAAIAGLDGVETVYPEVNFPALVGLDDREDLQLVQVIPAKVAATKMFQVKWGRPFTSDDEPAVVVGESVLRRLKAGDPAAAVGRTLRISSATLDLAGFNPADLAAFLSGRKLPVAKERHEFPIVGVVAQRPFAGPVGLQSDVFLPPGPARGIKRLPFRNVWDLLRMQDGRLGYASLTVRLVSPRDLERVKAAVRDLGFTTFALSDQFAEIRRGFLYLDMVLAAVGMIAIFVASLGIMNTMLMSILERTREIGVMKAVGARDADVRRVFFVESSVIGLAGGLAGYALGWVVSRLINGVVNALLARQGVPAIDYFAFPVWLPLGAVAFSVLVSLLSGVYPATRAARVDPVAALRHD